MSLAPRVGRTLFKSLQSAGRLLEEELLRCDALRARELKALKLAAGAPLPRELRGLLEFDAGNTGISDFISEGARRIADASRAPELLGADYLSGFAALRHLNERVAALRSLVYTTSSDHETQGVRVEVASTFQGADREKFFFKYQVRMFNDRADSIQLLSRAWTIVDLDGHVSSVEGPGVVGAFPVLAPKQSYEYSSGVPLGTVLGTQWGAYSFLTEMDSTVGQPAARLLQVRVAPFSHRAPSLDDQSDAAGNFLPSSARSPSSSRGNARGRRRRTDDLKRR